MAVAVDPRGAAVERLARRAWTRLVAVARAEAGPDGAEDAVQDVLLRLAAGVGDLPAEEGRADAYATVAVRRAARAGAVRRGWIAEDGEVALDGADEAVDRIEARRRLVAFAHALDGVPSPHRRVLALDAAGWSHAEAATACGVSERSVRRTVERHRATVLQAAVAAVDGSDCARFSATLDAYAAGAGRPRPGGPVAAHLEVCDACRAALRRATALRRALRAVLGAPLLPSALAPAGAAGGGAVVAVKLVLGALAVGGAVAVGTVGVPGVHDGTAHVSPTTPPALTAPTSTPAVKAPTSTPAVTAASPGAATPATPRVPAAARPIPAEPQPVTTAPAAAARPARTIQEGAGQRPAPARPTRTASARPPRARAAAATPASPPAAAPAASLCVQQALCAP